MNQLFITNLTIKKVRHLKDITVPLSKERMKHLIFTGKNGSGKTSVVEALAGYLNNVFTDKYFEKRQEWLFCAARERDKAVRSNKAEEEIVKCDQDVREKEENFAKSRNGLEVQFSSKTDSVMALAEKYHCILAYYRADRIFWAEPSEHVEKIKFREHYGMQEYPREKFVKYLLDLKMTEALARNNQNTEKADEIRAWFENLESLLKKIFADETVTIKFDEDSFAFHIWQQGKEPFDFNTLSSGYQAVLDIILDLMMRMQHQTRRSFDFNLPGIVLIDEIETHLHLELQRHIVPLLTTVFPNIQFVMTSHSPFILNSLNDVIIYDLENHLLVEHGLDNVPYDGIVEGYFGADRQSDILKNKFWRYKSLVKQEKLSDDELTEIAELEMYLDDIPDYLAIDVAAEYERLKLEWKMREDVDG